MHKSRETQKGRGAENRVAQGKVRKMVNDSPSFPTAIPVPLSLTEAANDPSSAVHRAPSAHTLPVDNHAHPHLLSPHALPPHVTVYKRVRHPGLKSQLSHYHAVWS